MAGISFIELVVITTICLLVLGPKKTLELAFFLGKQFSKAKKFLSDCQKQLELQDLSSVKNEITSVKQSVLAVDPKELDEITKTTQELKDAFKAPFKAETLTVNANLNTASTVDSIQAKTLAENKTLNDIAQKDHHSTSKLEVPQDLIERISKLETDVLALKKEIKSSYKDVKTATVLHKLQEFDEPVLKQRMS